MAVIFIGFALVSSFVLPRRNPNFPGHRLGLFLTITVVLFAGMMLAVEFFAVEEENPATSSRPPSPADRARYAASGSERCPSGLGARLEIAYVLKGASRVQIPPSPSTLGPRGTSRFPRAPALVRCSDYAGSLGRASRSRHRPVPGRRRGTSGGAFLGSRLSRTRREAMLSGSTRASTRSTPASVSAQRATSATARGRGDGRGRADQPADLDGARLPPEQQDDETECLPEPASAIASDSPSPLSARPHWRSIHARPSAG